MRLGAQPLRTPADLRRLRPFEPESDTPYVIDTVKIVVSGVGAAL